MAVCCCYKSNDGTDEGCTTYLGSSCPEFSGYTLTSSSSGICDNAISASKKLEEEILSRTKLALMQLDFESTTITLQTADGRDSASLRIDRRHKVSGERKDLLVNFVVPSGYKRLSFSSNVDARASAGGQIDWLTPDPHDGTIKIHAWADAFSYCEASVGNVQAVKE
jgi:hypothetical protein